MTDEEAASFLMTGTRTGKLAWVGADGRPHVAPVWFILDGDDLIFNTHRSTGKAKALQRSRQASLVVDDQEPPYSYVKVDGDVSFSEDLHEVRSVATAIGARYMGPDRAEEFGARNGTDGEVVVRLTPTRVQAFADVSD